MGITTRRRWSAAALMAGALALSACSAPAEEPAKAADTTQSATAEPTAAETKGAGPEAAPFDLSRMEMIDKTDVPLLQMNIAQGWVNQMAANPYSLSGQWTLDGNDPANTAKLWDNYFSDDLKAKLTAAGVSGDVTDFGAWTIMALAPPESTDPIKASPQCTMDYDSCRMIALSSDATYMQSQGGIRSETMDFSAPNRITFDYDVVVPVSLTEHQNAEGVLKGLLKVDIAFIENPAPGDGRPPYLIDRVNNELIDANADLASKSPELEFAGTTNPVK